MKKKISETNTQTGKGKVKGQKKEKETKEGKKNRKKYKKIRKDEK